MDEGDDPITRDRITISRAHLETVLPHRSSERVEIPDRRHDIDISARIAHRQRLQKISDVGSASAAVICPFCSAQRRRFDSSIAAQSRPA